MIAVSKAKVEEGLPVKTIRCPACKKGRICDAITHKAAVKIVPFSDPASDVGVILKCPHCKKLIQVTLLEIKI